MKPVNPLVSVYLVTKNRRKLLERAVKSVQSQTFRNIELIVVDDGSTDTTHEYLADLRAQRRVRVLSKAKSEGACRARNDAISLARGEYITGLDDDDEFLPGHIQVLLEHFTKERSFVSSSLLRRTGGSVRHGILSCGVGIVTLNRLLHYNCIGNQVFTTTERIREIGGFDPEFPALQDYDTWIRLVKKFGPGIKLRCATYIQDVSHGEGRISDNADNRVQALDALVAKHSESLEPRHFHSIELHRLILARRQLGIRQFVRLVNRGNVRSGFPYMLRSAFGR